MQDTAHYEVKSGLELNRGTWTKELKQKPWKDVAFSLTPLGLLNLLFYVSQDHLPSADSGLGPPTYTN